MCCLNMPFSIMLGWYLFNPHMDAEDEDEHRVMIIMKLITFYFWLLVLIPIDLILLPFNLLYAIALICFESDS